MCLKIRFDGESEKFCKNFLGTKQGRGVKIGDENFFVSHRMCRENVGKGFRN